MAQEHNGRLVLRGSPSPDESLLNFCERISCENGYESPFWLIGKSTGSADDFFEDESIRRIAHITACSYEDLSARSYRTFVGNRYEARFLGKTIKKEHIIYKNQKICAVCLIAGSSVCAAIIQII